MITMEGTVKEIRGKPLVRLTIEASSPATSAPQNAAAGAGMVWKSTNSSRRVLATAPINPEVMASRCELLNIMEKP